MSGKTSQEGSLNFTIKLGNTNIDHASYPIIAVTTDKTMNKIPSARVTLHDGDPALQEFPISNSKVFGIGDSIEIQAGYGNQLETIFKGIIIKQTIRARSHTHPLLIIDCKDIAYRTTLVPKNRSFANVADSDVMTSILGTYSGLGKEIESTAIRHESLVQQEITDWDFINLRAEANGKVVIVADGKVTIKKPNPKQASVASFVYGEDLTTLEVEMDARDQLQGAEGMIWKPNEQVSATAKVQDPGESSFGEVSYSELVNVNKQDDTTLYHAGLLAEKELETLAASLLELSRIAKIQGKITIQGSSAIQPDNVVEIQQGAKSFQGKAYVTGVRHKLVDGNWATELVLGLPNQRYMRKYSDVAGLPATGMVAPVHGLQLGIVKKLTEDPQADYRIFVCLPMVHKSNEGIWCRIASFYASQEVGSFFMPEIEDEVVVGFINDDPRSPVIVGALYNGKHKPPIVADADNTTKAIVSKSKLELTFNDKDQEIILKTPGDSVRTIRISNKATTIEIINGEANKIVLGDKDIEISSNQNIILNAKGSINLKAQEDISLAASSAFNLTGSNVSIEADMKAAMSGANSTEVKSNGTTVIQGTMVKIN